MRSPSSFRPFDAFRPLRLGPAGPRKYTWLVKTTSSSATYELKSAGASANWEAVYDADNTLIATATGVDPVFDLSGNTGNAVVAIRTRNAITATDTNCAFAWDGNSLTSFNASALTSVTDCSYAWRDNSLTSFDASALTIVTNCSYAWQRNSLTSFNASALTSVMICAYAWDGNSLTSFDASALTSVTNCRNAWRGNSLTSFDASGFATMGIPANNCFLESWIGGTNALNAASVESILVNIDLSGQDAPATGTDISIDSDGSPLTSAAQIAVENLLLKGWTPKINGSYVTGIPYSEGGDESLFDPSVLDPELVRYVDSATGLHFNDGKTPETAWISPGTVLSNNITDLQNGTHILFKRGLSYANDLIVTDKVAVNGARIVFGAYGDTNDGPPRLNKVEIMNSSYITVRDLDAKQIIFRGGVLTTNGIILNNVVRGVPGFYPNNGITIGEGASNTVVIGNTIYDIGSNDGITIHSSIDKVSPRDSHWIIDNTVIGNDGMEDCIDIAMSEPSGGDPWIAQDVKIVGNRLSTSALAGTSTLTGTCVSAIAANHSGRGVWIVGNTAACSNRRNIDIGSDKENVVLSGNVVFSVDDGTGDPTSALVYKSGPNIDISYNTFIHSVSNREVLNLTALDANATSNRFISNRLDSDFFVRLGANDLSTFQSIDSNVYEYVASDPTELSFQHADDGTPIADYNLFAEFVSGTGFEQNGISRPVDPILSLSLNPYDWDQSFYDSLALCDRDAGALDCNGARKGAYIKPIDGQDNNGYGWDGPLIVQRKLALLGIQYSA